MKHPYQKDTDHKQERSKYDSLSHAHYPTTVPFELWEEQTKRQRKSFLQLM